MADTRSADASPWPEWVADPAWSAIDLLSDVHLHADMPQTFEAWRDHLLTTPAQAVLMLGDLFEVWVGDDARHAPFEAQCVQVLREASRQRMLAFLPGNRDFLVGDELAAAAGIERLDDPTVLVAWQQRWLLSHGDMLCLDDHDYQAFRRQVRTPEWQDRFLGLPLTTRLAQARAMREASTAHQAERPPETWADVDATAATQWLTRARADGLIHGHTHRSASHALPNGGVRHVLGDWDFDHCDLARARILRLTCDGLQFIDLAA